MRRDDSLYLEHIRESIAKIEKYTNGIEEDMFMSDDQLQDAVIRQLQIIGEAAKRLSDDTTAKYSEVDWKDIAGMRDKLVHNYFGVDLDAVWDTVVQDLPKLRQALSAGA